MDDLMSPEGRESVRRRSSREALAERWHWPAVFVGALGVGVANYVGLIFAGLETKWSLILAAAIAAIVVGYAVVVSLTGGRVSPLGGDTDDELPSSGQIYATRAEASEEATARNMQLTDNDGYWRADEVVEGRWMACYFRTAKNRSSRAKGRGWFERVLDFLTGALP
jgi:hypothetical protein